ncbi:uncharacterized protein LOC142341329 [Convolutriloba macropyga]|uniref:uncharacterized protein LOC142341329 n=1 Tax=Convolutriloba macropyga TaxID=536237 RepID=UPI003F525DB9
MFKQDQRIYSSILGSDPIYQRKWLESEAYSSACSDPASVVDLCLTHKLKKSVSSPFSIGGLWNGGAITAGGKPEFSASLSLVSKLCKQLATTAELKQQLTDILCQVQDKQNAYKIMMKNYNAQNGQGSVSWAIQDFPSDRALKFLWMRLSLFAGILDRVIDQICKESIKFYEKDAFMCDPVVTTLLISLMVGPCSLDYSKAKTPDHLWTDPHAEELVLKHKIHSNIGYTSSQMGTSAYESGAVSNPDVRRALLSNNFKSIKPALMSIETGTKLIKWELKCT